jgi:hypothetical protein
MLYKTHLYVQKNAEHKASKDKSRVYLSQVIIYYRRVKNSKPETDYFHYSLLA